ncbi:DivIVA domain-containing protein [Caldicoprobacter algeriensis]|uniref:DivIVA domain-containing protein n=1 Tax=Caldicoprobacter algeriensis TaxID=699281 RepID=UPI00207953F2|nr:DivIVA domain-containing protein [Caldicoprobacter algeriensis]MCM8899681.1 DivIVA domain-containing protein [Caldicoprobacter algeriensis]
MPLTPMDIHNKEFSRSFRGYDEDEVDQFLDEVVQDFEKLYKENLELKERIGLLKEQLEYYKSMESTLKETLVTAQKTAEEVTASAHKNAELIIREAEQKAQKIIQDANEQVVKIRMEYEETRKQMQVFKTRFKTLLQEYLKTIERETELPSVEDQAGA